MGMTAKAHFEGNLFSTNNNKANLHILNDNLTQTAFRVRPPTAKPSLKQAQSGLAVTREAQCWLKDNLDIDLENLQENQYRGVT